MSLLETRKHNNSKTSDRSSGSVFFDFIPGKLYLSDGTVFEGKIPAWQKNTYEGEVVFNTGMTGYVESLTDPSYAGQLLTFTFPLIGNYGVQLDELESNKVQAAGVVVSEAAENFSHSQAAQSLLSWLQESGVPIITDVDTRALTKYLRTHGSTPGIISAKPVSAKGLKLEPSFVTIDAPHEYNAGHKKKIILVDCGAKENIVRCLEKFPITIKRVPYDYDYTNEQYDGVMLSNGPGDPTDYKATISIAQKALTGKKPVFGICLGTQIMALAAGAKTYKLPFGHRGHNQPCMDMNDERCYITSQNHGYAISEKSLPKGWRVLFHNLNDNSVEGIEHSTQPFFSVQFHPEAAPGPTDTFYLFERFYKSL